MCIAIFREKKELIHNIDESQKHWAEGKNLDTRVPTMHIYFKKSYREKQAWSTVIESKSMVVWCQGKGKEGGDGKGDKGPFSVTKMSVSWLSWYLHGYIHLSKFIKLYTKWIHIYYM